MPLKSDLTLNAALFDPANVTEETRGFNAALKKQMEGLPTWVDVSWSSLTQLYLFPYVASKRVGKMADSMTHSKPSCS